MNQFEEPKHIKRLRWVARFLFVVYTGIIVWLDWHLGLNGLFVFGCLILFVVTNHIGKKAIEGKADEIRNKYH